MNNETMYGENISMTVQQRPTYEDDIIVAPGYFEISPTRGGIADEQLLEIVKPLTKDLGEYTGVSARNGKCTVMIEGTGWGDSTAKTDLENKAQALFQRADKEVGRHIEQERSVERRPELSSLSEAAPMAEPETDLGIDSSQQRLF